MLPSPILPHRFLSVVSINFALSSVPFSRRLARLKRIRIQRRPANVDIVLGRHLSSHLFWPVDLTRIRTSFIHENCHLPTHPSSLFSAIRQERLFRQHSLIVALVWRIPMTPNQSIPSWRRIQQPPHPRHHRSIGFVNDSCLWTRWETECDSSSRDQQFVWPRMSWIIPCSQQRRTTPR